MKKPKTQTCANCWYARPCDDDKKVVCKHGPATVTPLAENTVRMSRPIMQKDDWCGAWRSVSTR